MALAEGSVPMFLPQRRACAPCGETTFHWQSRVDGLWGCIQCGMRKLAATKRCDVCRGQVSGDFCSQHYAKCWRHGVFKQEAYLAPGQCPECVVASDGGFRLRVAVVRRIAAVVLILGLVAFYVLLPGPAWLIPALPYLPGWVVATLLGIVIGVVVFGLVVVRD